MKKTQKLAGAFAGAALIASVAALPAQAQTIENSYPETPKTNASLPLVNTTHGSDHIKANILNPHPVCNAWEDKRTVVYKVTDDFLPVGTISTTNQTKSTIPLTQELSKTQTITLTVNGQQTETTSVSIGGNGSHSADGSSAGGDAKIAYELAKQVGGEASYSLSWNVGQTIGPYDVPAGYTGEATYGFRTVAMTGTQQYCKPNGTWSTPTAWRANVPIKNQVNVKLYDNPADSADRK